jgi:CheY-like chemotaxis protein
LEEEPRKVVLIVDDQKSDQAMLAWTLERAGVANKITCLLDGHEAIRYLNGDPPYADRQEYVFPAVMFLDLNMPVVNGWGVLDWIQGVSIKGKMRIFIHSQLKNVEEVKRLYDLGADSFLKKPVNGNDLRSLIEHFPEPWDIKGVEVTSGASAGCAS